MLDTWKNEKSNSIVVDGDKTERKGHLGGEDKPEGRRTVRIDHQRLRKASS